MSTFVLFCTCSIFKYISPAGLDPDRLYHGARKPNSRLVSTRLISRPEVELDPELSHMVMQWGQFLDHDMDHSMEAVSRETFREAITVEKIKY